MTTYYQCRDCSFRGKQFPQGRCPACGSHNIRKPYKESEKPRKNSPYSLGLCIALWAWLIYTFWLHGKG